MFLHTLFFHEFIVERLGGQITDCEGYLIKMMKKSVDSKFCGNLYAHKI